MFLLSLANCESQLSICASLGNITDRIRSRRDKRATHMVKGLSSNKPSSQLAVYPLGDTWITLVFGPKTLGLSYRVWRQWLSHSADVACTHIWCKTWRRHSTHTSLQVGDSNSRLLTAICCNAQWILASFKPATMIECANYKLFNSTTQINTHSRHINASQKLVSLTFFLLIIHSLKQTRNVIKGIPRRWRRGPYKINMIWHYKTNSWQARV